MTVIVVVVDVVSDGKFTAKVDVIYDRIIKRYRL